MNYIITPGMPIVKSEDSLIHVLTSEQIKEYQNSGFRYKERIYKMKINGQPCEIVCGEIWKKNDKEHSVIIPAYLLMHRPYQLDVYMYAINLYSAGDISQRAAAQATRLKFELKTFSHTIISRAMNALSEKLEEYKEELANAETDVMVDIPDSAASDADTSVDSGDEHGENSVSGASHMPEEEKNRNPGEAGAMEYKKRFPTLKVTQKKRELISSFFKGKLDIKLRHGFMEACVRIAVWWHGLFGKLLI